MNIVREYFPNRLPMIIDAIVSAEGEVHRIMVRPLIAVDGVGEYRVGEPLEPILNEITDPLTPYLSKRLTKMLIKHQSKFNLNKQ